MLGKYEQLNNAIKTALVRLKNRSDNALKSTLADETKREQYKRDIDATSRTLQRLLDVETINDVKDVLFGSVENSDEERADIARFRELFSITIPTTRRNVVDSEDIRRLFDELQTSAGELIDNLNQISVDIALYESRVAREKRLEKIKTDKDLDFIELEKLNRINLYNRVYHDKSGNFAEKIKNSLDSSIEKIEAFYDEIEEIEEQLTQAKEFLNDKTDPISLKLLAEVNKELEDINAAKYRYENVITKIEDDQYGLLKTIKDAQKKDYIILDDGVTYSIKKGKDLHTFSLDGSDADRTYAHDGERKSNYIPLAKRVNDEMGVYTKQSSGNPNFSQFIIKNDPKSPEWVSNAFPEDEKNRWDHALRWANNILQQRSGPPYKPLYLEQGAKSPEEVVYLKEALEELIKLKIEMRAKQEPELLSDPNFSKIIVSQRKLGLLESIGGGISSLYNKSTKEAEVAIFKEKIMQDRSLQDVSQRVTVQSKKGEAASTTSTVAEYKSAIKEAKIQEGGIDNDECERQEEGFRRV